MKIRIYDLLLEAENDKVFYAKKCIHSWTAVSFLKYNYFIEQSIRENFKGDPEVQAFRCTSKFLFENVRLIYVQENAEPNGFSLFRRKCAPKEASTT